MSVTKKEKIKISCQAADSLPIDKLKNLQGKIKKINKINIQRLKESILKYGFSMPIFIWANGENYILDGHQRLKVLIDMQKEGYLIPKIPVAYIDAENERQAREKLIQATSQYGEFVINELTEFLEKVNEDFNYNDIRLTDTEIYFEEQEMASNESDQNTTKEIDIDKYKLKTKCPRCGMEFNP
ncbi:MAG: ParB N-terminal domain-containing protein [Cyclobacteriaceae bacterium]